MFSDDIRPRRVPAAFLCRRNTRSEAVLDFGVGNPEASLKLDGTNIVFVQQNSMVAIFTSFAGISSS